jgi:hypothetical protein
VPAGRSAAGRPRGGESSQADWTFGSGGFAKLYGERLAQSSLLDRDVATRWVFVFMLSQADAEGRYRCATVEGLARHANVTREQAARALRELQAPDHRSTSPQERGRRIARIPGGWRIVNAGRYRAFRTRRQQREAAKKRRQRQAARAGGRKAKGDMSRDVPRCPPRGAPDVRRQTSDVRGQRENGRPSVRVSPAEIGALGTRLDGAGHAELVDGLLAVSEGLAEKVGIGRDDVIARVSRIEASAGREARAFADPRAKGVSAAWLRASLARALAWRAELERPVPL